MNTSLCLICFARVVALRISMSLFTGGRTLQFLGSLFLGLITPTISHSKTTSVIRSINNLEHWSTCLNNELTETDNTVILSNSLLIYSNITDWGFKHHWYIIWCLIIAYWYYFWKKMIRKIKNWSVHKILETAFNLETVSQQTYNTYLLFPLLW